MPDNSFMTTLVSAFDNTLEVEYRECVGLVTVEIGRQAQLFLTPADAAVVAEKLLAALDVYASTLKTVA